MPTYEYRCKSCGHEFEEFQMMSADPLTMCPKCAKPTLKRLMSSGVGLIFKGSGFYLTDYKKSNASSSSSAKSESKPESKSDPKSDSKQEAKPDTKQETKPSTDAPSGPSKKISQPDRFRSLPLSICVILDLRLIGAIRAIPLALPAHNKTCPVENVRGFVRDNAILE